MDAQIKTEIARQQMPIAAIRQGPRFRQDLGDIEGLAESIAKRGLMHPVVITPDGKLIAGARRIADAIKGSK